MNMKTLLFLSLHLLLWQPLRRRPGPQTQQALDGLPTRSSATDAAITTFHDPHRVYLNRDIVLK